MKKTKKRAVPVWMIVVEVFLAVLFAFLCIWWFGFSYPFFDSVTTEGARIPGLASGISPQGLCVLPANEQGYDFAMSGYISGAPSRVYLIDEESEEEHYVTFTKDGEDIKTHFGGVTATDDYMYIASGKEIVRVLLDDVFAAENGEAVPIIDSLYVEIGAAFCYAYGGQLFVGEFYRPGNYETDSFHHITVNGKTNHAFVYVYDLDENSEGGVAYMSPTKVLSVPDQVQGIAVTDEYIFLSTSYGLPDSNLFIYENKLNGEPDGGVPPFLAMSSTRPLYILEPKASADFLMPCMSEEICVKDGKLYILFESLSNKYRYVVHHRISHILSVNIEDILDIDVKQSGAWF